jgi:DNA-binding response OmpR family regulator
MSLTPLIIVVDDEADTRILIGDYIALNGFRVKLCDGATTLRAMLPDEEPVLVVLDLNMPGEDGLSVIRFLKGEHSIPVIMLTATASLIDRVVGLELGADDYLAKPCELRELLARIRSVIRRSSQQPRATEKASAASVTVPRREVRFGAKLLDLDTQLLRDDDGTELQLMPSEFNLLKAFAENPRRVLTRERLLTLANARDVDPFDRSIDVRITRIRRKIETDPARPTIIRTIRGSGYLFAPEG